MSEGAGPVTPAPTRPRRFGPWRLEVRAYLELLAVTGMTVARPTFGILSNNSAIFVTRHTRPAELIALALLLVLLPPLVLWLVEVGIGALLPRVRRAVHTALLAIVAGIFVVAVLKKQTDLASAVLIVVALIAAGVCAWLVWRFAATSLFLRYLAVAPVFFAVLFVTSASVRAAVFEPDPGVAKVEVEHPNRVVMVVLDELPVMSLLDGQGAIDADLFPKLAALTSTSTWYRNTTTVAPYTGAAVPAILTGDYRTGDTDAQVAASAPHSIFTMLGGTYDMNVHESVTRLCPVALCSTDEDGTIDQLVDLASASRDLWWENASPERVAQNAFDDGDVLGDPTALATGERFVGTLEPTRRPRLDLLHVLLPHQGWHYLPSGQDYLEDTAAPGLYWDYTWGSQWAGTLARERHLLQLAAADQLVGDIVTRLRRIGAYDDTLLVVTADHGIAFDNRQPIRGVSRQNAAQILWVPMIIKAPGQTEPVVDDRAARTIDLLPTIADHLGVKLPWRVDGRSLLGAPVSNDTLKVLEWEHNLIKPDREGFIHVPRQPGFELAMTGSASRAKGPVAERLYRIGLYGALLGQPAEPLTRAARDPTTVTLDDLDRFRSVDPDARRAPWTYVQGTIHGDDIPADASLAITVNGVVAGLSGAYLDPLKPDQRSFWGTLNPAAFRAGDNTIRVFLVEGTPEAPELVPLKTTR